MPALSAENRPQALENQGLVAFLFGDNLRLVR